MGNVPGGMEQIMKDTIELSQRSLKSRILDDIAFGQSVVNRIAKNFDTAILRKVKPVTREYNKKVRRKI